MYLFGASLTDHFDDLAADRAAASDELTRFDALLGRALAGARAPLLLVTADVAVKLRMLFSSTS